jgi:GNAT superfamily N-acetyltransferase
VSLAYRPAVAADMPLVVGSWLDSFRTAHAAGLIAMDDWRAVMEPQIEKLLARPGAVVFVAHRPGEDAEHRADLYGWIAAEPDIALVHYVYVKHSYRRMGLARGLLGAAGIKLAEPFEFSCKTAVVRELQRKIPRARWNPLAARFPKTNPRPE